MITIITPFYNSQDTFERTFSSVMSQTYQEFIWFVVDDGSEDAQFEWLQQFCKQDRRVKVVSNSRSKGAGGARNTALLMCGSALVTFLDSDDTWDPSFLSIVVGVLSTGVPAVTTGYRRINDCASDLGEFRPLRVVEVGQLSRGCDVSCLSSGYNLERCSTLPLFGEVKARNDLYFVYNFLKQGLYVVPVPEVLATYYVGRPSLSSNKFKLVKYMYQFSRHIGYGPLRSCFEVVCWAYYGTGKYWTRYSPTIFK